jgi:(E)-4-hydroxy-3-methylbut-2-enyl-diphosphate synthase
MCNTKTSDVLSTAKQINELEDAGCEVVRVSIPDIESASAISKIKEKISIPLVGDIHFDYKLALLAIENGIDKIRINPGNIGDGLAFVVKACSVKNIPIRVGVNSGSLEKDILAKYGSVTKEALVESALSNIKKIEDLGYDNIVVSIKSSDVMLCYEAYKLLSEKTRYPLHVGITEAGTLWSGNIKSSIGLGLILNEGIGDTIRVSLSGSPIEEVKTAKLILKTLNIKKGGIDIISCPTCARTNIDIIFIADNIEKSITPEIRKKFENRNFKIAVMGCAVNGPGEAKDCDIGIAGGNKEALLFKNGEIISKIDEDKIIETIIEYLEKI